MRVSTTSLNLDSNYPKPEKDEVLGLSQSRSFTSAVTWLDDGRPSNEQDGEEGEWLENAHRTNVGVQEWVSKQQIGQKCRCLLCMEGLHRTLHCA